MRNRDRWDGLDLLDLECALVGEPAAKAKQRVVVGADEFRQRSAGDGADATWAEDSCEGGEQVNRQEEQIAHESNVIT